MDNKVTEILHVTSRYFCAGAVLEKGMIIRAAPIIKYMIGWSVYDAVTYCTRRKWKWQIT